MVSVQQALSQDCGNSGQVPKWKFLGHVPNFPAHLDQHRDGVRIGSPIIRSLSPARGGVSPSAADSGTALSLFNWGTKAIIQSTCCLPRQIIPKFSSSRQKEGVATSLPTSPSPDLWTMPWTLRIMNAMDNITIWGPWSKAMRRLGVHYVMRLMQSTNMKWFN